MSAVTVPAARGSALRAHVRSVSPDTWAILGILGCVVLANLPYLLDFVDPNPLGPRGGLAVGAPLGWVSGQPVIDPNYGFISQALTHRAMLDLWHLQLPWWNPYQGTGTPLAGEMQSAALFPPSVLVLFSNGQLYEHILLEALAGVSTYLVLRRLALGRLAAVAGGVAFALNGTFAWFAHATVNPIAFLPLLVLGIELAYSAALDGRHGGWWLIAVAGALSFYAGFPEVAYINTVLCVAWFAWRLGCLPRPRRTTLFVKGALAAAVGIALSAPLLIAFLDYLSQGDVGFHGTSLFGSIHFPAQALPQLVLPYVYGPIFAFGDPKLVLPGIWEGIGGYLSLAAVMFALLGVVSSGRRALRIILCVWIVLVLARMYGQIPLLGHVLGLLPGMSRVAFFRYATPSLMFAVIVLAVCGLDAIARRTVSRRALLTATFVALLIVAVAAIGARSLADQLSGFGHHPYYEIAVAWGVFIVAAAGVLALLRRPRIVAALAAGLVALDAFVLFVAPELSAPRAVTLDVAPATFLQRHLGTARFFTLGPLQPNYGSYFGIASVNINDVPIPSAYASYVKSRLDPYVDPTVFVGFLGGGRSIFAPSTTEELLTHLAGYRGAGVAYVLAPAGQRLPQSPGNFRLVARTPTTWIYHLSGSAPYFTASGPGCRLAPRGRESVTVTCPSRAIIVRRETDLRGWTARVDGRAVPIQRIDSLFQSVAIGPGRHQLSFTYRPPYVLWGFAAFLLGLAALIGAPLRRRIIAGRSASAAPTGAGTDQATATAAP